MSPLLASAIIYGGSGLGLVLVIKCEREDPRIHSGDESEPNI